MDFAYSDDHQQVAALARQVLGNRVSDEYHRDQGTVLDSELWQQLADAGLLAVSLSEDCGGSGLGFIGICQVLREQGRVLAPLPLLPVLVGALSLQEGGQTELATALGAGEVIMTASALPGLVRSGERVRGCLPLLPYARDARWLLATLDEDLALVDLEGEGVSLSDGVLSNNLPACEAELDAPAVVLPGGAAVFTQRVRVATAMVQLGVIEEALQRTARFTTERSQFGQPLAAFQAVSQRAADGYIDVEALRATTESAAWRLHEGLDASLEAETAYWWAAEAGHRVAHTAQHLHGGIGADLEYPVHRYFLWAKQLEFDLGGAAGSEDVMGNLLAGNAALGARK